jgi:hypothetical protein
MRKNEPIPEPKDLVEAAVLHAAEVGDFEYAIGDLQDILTAAWRIMTPSQRMEVLAQPELADLAILPEFEPLIGHLIRDDRTRTE